MSKYGLAQYTAGGSPYSGHWGVMRRRSTANCRWLPLTGQPPNPMGLKVATHLLSKDYWMRGSYKVDEQQGTMQFPLAVWEPGTNNPMEIPGYGQPPVPAGQGQQMSGTTGVTAAPAQPVGPQAQVAQPAAVKATNQPSQADNRPTAADLQFSAGPPTVSIELMSALLDAIDINQAVMLWGPPGVGKSEGVADYARKHGLELHDVRLSQLNPVDLRGIGAVDLENNQCRWLPPDFLPHKAGCLLLLDEVTSAAPQVQAAAYQLVLDRKTGGYTLPRDCRIIAAGNRTSDRGIAFRMPAPLANRFVHFDIKAEMLSWKRWAIANGVRHEIIAFVASNEKLLHDLNDNNCGTAWPSPRSWVMASNFIKALPQDQYDQSCRLVAVAAAVGGTAAAAFGQFLQSVGEKILKQSEQILKGSQPPAPTGVGEKIMLASALAASVMEKIHIERACKWASSQLTGEELALFMLRLDLRAKTDPVVRKNIQANGDYKALLAKIEPSEKEQANA